MAEVLACQASKRQRTRGASASIDVESSQHCEVCRGTLHVLGLGDCPQCVFGADAAEATTGGASVVTVDEDLRQCDICGGSKRVLGYGDCPSCVPEVELLETTDSPPPSQSSGATAELVKQCEICKGSRQIRGLGDCPKCLPRQSSSSSQSQVVADRAVAELLDAKESNEMQIQELTRERDALKEKAATNGSDLWHNFATIDEDVTDEDKVRALFLSRQQGNPILQIEQCIKVQNDRLGSFRAMPGNRPTLIFHGSPERNVANIMVTGLSMEFCGGCGGIFGAMNPQTSLSYSAKAGDQRHFMALCVYDLPLGGTAPQPGAAYSVPRDDATTVLWLLKVKSA